MAESELPHRRSSPPNNGIAGGRADFPKSQDDFQNDPRVSYSKLDNKWILEDDDGTEWGFDEGLKRWVPSLDDELLEQQQAAYAVAGVDESEPAHAAKKRKNADGHDEDGRKSSKKSRQNPDRIPPKNTAVYVTSIPDNATVDEVRDVFSKYGVIAEEIDSGAPRIKIYTDENGKPKGDALVVYFRPESVQLAIQMLDDSDFRLGEEGPTGKMRVKEADRSYKKVQDHPDASKPGPRTRDKKKIIKKTQKMNNKLADWDDDDPGVLYDANSKWDKLVILKHMFTLQELEDDPAAILDIKEDIREECSKLGEVTNVILYDKEPEGVVSVRFGGPEAARACVTLMRGRHFDGRTVEAYIADGTERYKKTSEKKAAFEDSEDEDEDEKRLDKFSEWIEKEKDAKKE